MPAAIKGIAYACQACWHVYTAPDTVVEHRQMQRAGCPRGSNAPTAPWEVTIDHQGQVSGLPGGVQATNVPSKSCWAVAPPQVPPQSQTIQFLTITQANGTTVTPPTGPPSGLATNNTHEQNATPNDSATDPSATKLSDLEAAEVLIRFSEKEVLFD